LQKNWTGQQIPIGPVYAILGQEIKTMKKVFSLLLLLMMAAGQSQAGFPAKEKSSLVLTWWMDFHSRVVRSFSGIPHVSYSRHFSYTAIAVYESLVDSDPSYRSLGGQLNGLSKMPVNTNPDLRIANVNAVYAECLRHFYGANNSIMTRIDSMETATFTSLSADLEPDQIESCRKYAKQLVTHIMNWAASDGSVSTKRYVTLEGEGIWKPNSEAVSPFWSDNRGMLPALINAYHLSSPVYSKEINSSFYRMAHEVYETSKKNTPGQKAIALFWDDSPNGRYMTAFGHWTSIASKLISAKKLSLLKAVEAYVRMTVAMHDAAILAWKGKYEYNVVRPITYIQQYFDQSWQPLIATPGHPEFPAAHATISQAAAMALTQVFGKSCQVRDNSYEDIGMPERKFSSLQEAAREAGLSRLYGGIHYRYSIEEGFKLGEAVAQLLEGSVSFQRSP
jgi:hypothetical protein